MRILCDESRCIGCLACVVSCLDRHCDASQTQALSPRRYRKTVRPSGLMQYETYSCRHCAGAPCIGVCPMDALFRDRHGFVALKRDKCVGCGACVRACPFQIPQIDKDWKMVKCGGCGGEAPACVSACPMGALRLGD